MLPIHQLIWHEWRAEARGERTPEPSEAMDDPEQIRAYIKAYEWGGATSALQLHHLQKLSRLVRPGDTVLDLACGPGPLLLELAPLYPTCRFIGVDLSPPMLAVLRETCAQRGIKNITTLCEDIRTLPSFAAKSIDAVITTSALHHLPDTESVGRAFERIAQLLAPNGAVYVFDFGLVRSQRTRDLLVAEVAKFAPEITSLDYAHSLRAAFPVEEVVQLARRHLGRELVVTSSRFIDFFYSIQSTPRGAPVASVNSYVENVFRRSRLHTRIEALMLRYLQRAR